MRRVEVIETIDDLNRVIYDFWLDGVDLYLNTMLVQQRETTRHKFRTDMRNSYSRINGRDFGIKEEPEIDISVQADAVDIARNNVTFKKWRNK